MLITRYDRRINGDLLQWLPLSIWAFRWRLSRLAIGCCHIRT